MRLILESIIIFNIVELTERELERMFSYKEKLINIYEKLYKK